MDSYSFLSQVRSTGRYGSSGEASRAANAVFGTIKGWLSPTAAEKMSKQLSVDASLIWQYSPLAGKEIPMQFCGAEAEVREATQYFILMVQQLGSYRSLEEARLAACSVLSVLTRALPMESASLLSRVFPRELIGTCSGSGEKMPAREGIATAA
jgi:uncharacterized protein (DUF2267 family)